MDHQTTVDRRTYRPVRQQIGTLVHDALTLAELQVELLKVDLRDARQGVALSVGLVGAGVVLALGSTPVLLIAAAQALVAERGWPASWAYLAIGATAVFTAALLAWSGARRATRAMKSINRSTSEFGETLRWFKGALHHPGRSDRDAQPDGEFWTSRSRV